MGTMRPDSLCILPWIHLEANSLGFVHPCCKSTLEIREGGKPVQLSEATLEQAWNSSDLVQLRRDFLDGKKPPSCSRCWAEEAAGVHSKRMVDNRKFRSHQYRATSDIATEGPVYLDLKLGNTCNLKCRICSSVHSSKWSDEEMALLSDKNRPRKNFELGKWPKNNKNFWDNLEKLIAGVEYLDFTGGEPFLIKQHFDVLRFCIELGYANRIELHYNTNGTVFPEKAVLDYWPHFKKVDLMVSLDGVGERFEYQRFGAVWSEVEINTRKLSEAKNVHFVLCYTVNFFNVFYVEEFVRWAEKNGYVFWINYLHDPAYFCVQHLSEPVKETVLRRLENIKLTSVDVQDQIQRLARFIVGKKSNPQITLETQHWVDRSDFYRAEKFNLVFPELAHELAAHSGWAF